MKKITTFILLFVVSIAQNNKIMEAFAIQVVNNDTLYIDIFLKRLVPTVFSLGAANFSLYVNNNALDLSNAELKEIGPWSMNLNPADYTGPDYLYKDNFFTVNILPITASSGNGTIVDTNLTKLCRVAIPILDASQTNTLKWRIAPIAIHKWTYENITDSVLFTLGNPTINLCSAPTEPIIYASSNVACQQTVVYIDSTSAIEYEIYKDGNLLSNINVDTFVVTSPGTYYVIAKNYACSSVPSNSITIEIHSPLSTPTITLQGDSLVCTNCDGQDIQTYQWLLNGSPINNINSPTLSNLTPGIYQLKIINACGEKLSNTYEYIITRTSIEVYGTKIIAYPVPADKNLNILFSSNEPQNVNLSMFNTIGEKILDIYEGLIQNETKNISINTSELASGTYFIKGEVSNKPLSLKIIVVH